MSLKKFALAFAVAAALFGGRAAVGHGGRHVRAKLRGARALDAHDAHIAVGKLADEIAQFLTIDIEAIDIEHNGPAKEETGRTGGQIVEPHQPVLDGQLWGQCERKEGAPLEADRPGLS